MFLHTHAVEGEKKKKEKKKISYSFGDQRAMIVFVKN